MNISFSIKKLDYGLRAGNLAIEASGVVKSKKHFPYYVAEDGTVEIFKPLSKTKPFTTPLFAYAEVFWSNVIRRYFLEVPIYHLAVCTGYSETEPKYYDYGTVVPSVCQKGEHLVNLLEFYRDNPDMHVNIDNYVNYCMLFYDYTDIFESRFIQENVSIGEELAMQVLVSILKGDQNYHYENVAFICDEQNQVLRLAPMIDHEFSTMFLFPDDVVRNVSCFSDLLDSIEGKKCSENRKIKDAGERKLLLQSSRNLNRNIRYISVHYPNVVKQFQKGLDGFEKEIDKIHLYDGGYLFPCNSNTYQVGQIRYKDEEEEKAKELEKTILCHDIDLQLVEGILKKEIAKVIETMRKEFFYI